MKATAVIYTATGTAQKEFEVEITKYKSIFSPELVDWLINHTDRTSNLLNIIINGRSKIYHL